MLTKLITQISCAVTVRVVSLKHYSPQHVYQDEWVWNQADIDGSRIVYARDLGADENENLIRYYPSRKVLLLEPDGDIPRVSAYDNQSQ